MFGISVPRTQSFDLTGIREQRVDHLSGVKEQLRKNYSEALEYSLPDELADLINQLDRAP